MKAVSKEMGHASEIITVDVYGDKEEIILTGVKEIEEFINHLLGISRAKDTEKNSYINDTLNYLLMRKLGIEKPFNLELFRTK